MLYPLQTIQGYLVPHSFKCTYYAGIVGVGHLKQLTVVLQARLELPEIRGPRLRSHSTVLAASQVQIHVTPNQAVGGAEPDLVAEYDTVAP